MYIIERAPYVVIKEFYYQLHLFSEELTHYQIGQVVNLRVNGKLANKWLEKGYIQLVPKKVE